MKNITVNIMHLDIVKAIILAAAVASSESVGTVKSEDSESVLWQKMDALGSHMPLTKENFETILGTSTFLLKQDAYITIWRGEPVALGGDLGMSTLQLKLDSANRFAVVGSARIELVGKCITLDDVERHFGEVEIFDTPRGHSIMDATVYRSRQQWGGYFFSFREIARNCLSAISLNSEK